MTAVTVALTGASGLQYGFRLIECLLIAGKEINLLVSNAARMVAALEMDLALPKSPTKLQQFVADHLKLSGAGLKAYAEQDWMAPIASGSAAADMVICPCTSGTLASVAQGLSENLMERAADVALKEQKKLLLVPREMPYSSLHLANMLKLAQMGAVILPPNPGFYHRPQSISDLIDFVVARILDHLGVSHQLMVPWGEEKESKNRDLDHKSSTKDA